MKINKTQSLNLAKKFDINLKIISLSDWQDGLNIELEHGKKMGKITNITNNNLDLTAKIAIAHLIEDPYYYKYLIKLEKKRELYWKGKKKPNIFN